MKSKLDRSSDVAVIIVNYGTAELAIAAVQSVLDRGHGGRRVEVHLVDNASPDGDAARFIEAHARRDWGARVTLWLEKENHGFGRGNNLVLQALSRLAEPPRYVMLLNPDARLENEALAILADVLDRRPDVAVAGAGISKPDGTPVTAAFRFPSVIAEFAQAANFGPIGRLASSRLMPLASNLPEGPVGWVSGAALLARFEAFRAVGFFDPVYFLYYEEVDLMLQLTRRGGEVRYVPAARVIHAEGAATGVRSGTRERRRRPAYWYRSWHHYWMKNHGRAGAALAAAGWVAGAAFNQVMSKARGQQPHAPLGFFADFWGLAVRPILGLEEALHE
ncbi:glycosyltransferase family 2 protein [Rhodobacter sp. CZR27]|uniref:glycosyltransferase family 2 protein n=1 Tax=Rhodobacter sp. CZR27 TaxID=2033869 RepID=UPI000BBEE947|nr:glycosyltransferase family 2 protein [Rhodobacter sp. CZR27]